MKNLSTTSLAGLAIAALALSAACEQELAGDDAGAGGSQMADAGQLADGSAGAGGAEDDAAAGADAGGGDCVELDEARCDGRMDCAARLDVFGGFVRCGPLEQAPCAALDEPRCAEREGCEWDGAACAPQQVTCDELPDEGACGEADCHWYDDACHEQAPNQCDQPDPAACEAAGCEWGPFGCRRPVANECAELAQAACSARAECVWRGDRCEDDPATMACGDLDMFECAMRNDCGWTGESCVERPAGACGELDEAGCSARGDCAGIYDDAGAFVGCEIHEVDCAAVPPDACDRTPGCHTIDDARAGARALRCVSDDPFGCGQLAPFQCNDNPNCRFRSEVVCDGDGAPDEGGGGGGGFFPGDADRAPGAEPFPGGGCQEVNVCEPDPAAIACLNLTPEDCQADPGCELQGRGEDCACDPGGFAPCDCQEALECRPVQGGEGCGALPLEQCIDDPRCEWLGDGGGVCACEIGPDGVENCVCEAPPEGGCVDAGGPDGCWDIFDAFACADRPDCEWIDEGGAPLPDPPDCGCPEGDPNCGCALPAPPPPGGFCQPGFDPPVDPCADVSPDVCPDIAGCELVEVCEALPLVQCRMLCQAIPPPPNGCGALEEVACVDDPACEPIMAQACGCQIDAAGEEICDCVDVFGGCADAAAPPAPIEP